MALQVRVQLVVVTEDGQARVQDLAKLAKEHERIEQPGLRLSEAKAILRELQRQVLERQIAVFLSGRVACPSCGRARGSKFRLYLREIADQLVISETTVKTHVNNIFNKAGLRDRAQAVVYAVRHGLGPE